MVGRYGDLWIDNFSDGSLTRLHPATGAARTVGVGEVATKPTALVVDGSVVWVADWASPELVRLSAVGSPRIHRISLPTGDPAIGVWDVATGAGAVWATTPRDHALWRIYLKDQQRQAREPSRPADRRRSRRQRLGDVAKSYSTGTTKAPASASQPASAPCNSRQNVEQLSSRGVATATPAFCPHFQFGHEVGGKARERRDSKPRPPATVLFDR